MKKGIALAVALTFVLSATACKKGNDDIDQEPTETASEKIIPNDVDENSDEALKAKEAVSKMLDAFISADFDRIKEALTEEDREFFNFDSEDQCEFYKTILPKIKYEFTSVAEHDGVYGVMTTITSPDMASVYGNMIISIMESGESYTEESFRKKNVETMKSLLNSDDGTIGERSEELYIYVENDNGKFIPRCDIYLANELLGGYPEASEEIGETLSETINELGE
jgi:hypothetical protein